MKLLFSTLLSLLTYTSGIAQWNTITTINTPVCAMPNKQDDARIVTDGKAGGIISWVDARVTSGLGDIYVQRLNSRGIPLWTTNGKAICNDLADQTAPVITESIDGGAIITWQDWRSGDRDIYAQKVDSSGNVLWMTNGIAICAKVTHQRSPKILNDGLGGAYIVWEDSINGAYDIYLQHVNASGNLSWNSTGIAVCAAADAQINPRLVMDGSGGVIVVWQDRRNGIDYTVYAQRIDAAGILQWAANGIVICTAAGAQINPKMSSDDSGGAIITWQDKRTNIDYDVYAQRVNGAGSLLWGNTGAGVCTVSGNQSAIDMTTEGINGAIISWKDERTGSFAVYAAFLNRSGVATWTANGIGIGPGINPNIIGDTNGGAIVTWQDESISASNYNIYAQRLTSAGVRQWGATGTAVCTAANIQESPKHVGTGDGGAIFVWDDLRNGSHYDIYAHKLSANGTVTGIESSQILINSIRPYPNPMSSVTTFYWVDSGNTNPETWNLIIRNTLGEIVFQKNYNGAIPVIFDKKDLKSGLYTFQVQTENAASFGKLMILD